ncbi:MULTISPECIES: FCD domain-containing protein [unclassified Bradyrhizobium]|uniref:GntR family transcriptional regulator n=1 Tax=unclassified Bradyrhizobium TaxID=2631580 RepID=UPI003394ED82
MKTALSTETLATATYLKLRTDVIAGTFPFGAKLKILELCERYEVSTAPMREALNRAAKDGIVSQSEQRGFSVAPLSVEDLDDLLQTRLLLNEIGLRRSFEFGGAAWEEQVLVSWHRLSRISYTPGAIDPAWESAHRVFHRSLISACKAPRIITYCDQLFDSADRYRFMARTAPAKEPRFDDHKSITDAVIARQPDEAVAHLKRHFQETADRCRARLLPQDETQSAASERPDC